MKHSLKARRSGKRAVALLGTAMATATALAAGGPAVAARTTGPPRAVSRAPALRIGPHLSVLPAGARNALAPATKSKELFGVFCTSASDCWAVGKIVGKNATVNQVLHWTGKKWFPVKVPNQAGTAKGDLNELLAVRCTSVKDCWAVGDSQQGGVAQLDQALHYDGQNWTLEATPAPGGTSAGAFNTLDDVACTSAKDCWAVGQYGLVGSSMQPEVAFNQVLHWNGRQWMLMKTPNPGGISMGHINGLNGVRCTTPTSCWAAGVDGTILTTPDLRNEMLFFNGKKWTAVKVPDPAGIGKLHISILITLACTSKPNCWAVGVSGNLKVKKQFEHNEALHWNGKNWVAVKTPNPDPTNDEFVGVTCVAAQDCWAVGTSGFGPGRNEAAHWNGAKWALVPIGNGGGTGKGTTNTLESVRCTSHSNCWAVGEAELTHGDINQIFHWNGIKWQGN